MPFSKLKQLKQVEVICYVGLHRMRMIPYMVREKAALAYVQKNSVSLQAGL